MAKYHISPTTGQPNLCRASIKPCPIGGAGDHYTTKQEARKAFEETMKDKTVVTHSDDYSYEEKLQQLDDYKKNLSQAWETLSSARDFQDGAAKQEAWNYMSATPYFKHYSGADDFHDVTEMFDEITSSDWRLEEDYDKLFTEGEVR